MSRVTTVVLFGASGRMGQEILRIAPEQREIDIIAALVRLGSAVGEEPVWPARPSSLSYQVTLDPDQHAEVLIDFANAASFDSALALAVDREMAFVSGTTGLSEAQRAALEQASQVIPVYPLTEGLTSRRVHSAIGAALERLPDVPEWQDETLLSRQGWPRFSEALRALHNPQTPPN